MKLLGLEVIHKKFGTGVITHITDNKVSVRFGNSEKLFLFPDVFGKYVAVKNKSIQRQLEELNESYLKSKKQEKEKINREKTYRNRLYNMRIHQRSQAVFDISQEEISDMEKTAFLDAGCYLSGLRKGTPRIPSALQPNSGILLTKCEYGKDEKERKIIGAVMVDDTFWGKECTDGQIRLHKKYIMILPEKSRFLFWNTCKQESIPNAWGKVAFKYLPNHIMKQILQEIRKKAVGTELENKSEEFYHYFCKLNRLAESI